MDENESWYLMCVLGWVSVPQIMRERKREIRVLDNSTIIQLKLTFTCNISISPNAILMP